MRLYLQSGNVAPDDLAWNGATWVPVASLLGVLPTAPPPTAGRSRHVALLILMAVVWWLILWLVPCVILISIFIAITNPHDPSEAGKMLGRYVGAPLMLGALALSIWLTAIGKLPGTRK